MTMMGLAFEYDVFVSFWVSMNFLPFAPISATTTTATFRFRQRLIFRCLGAPFVGITKIGLRGFRGGGCRSQLRPLTLFLGFFYCFLLVGLVLLLGDIIEEDFGRANSFDTRGPNSL
jgi:hypothetical protein